MVGCCGDTPFVLYLASQAPAGTCKELWSQFDCKRKYCIPHFFLLACFLSIKFIILGEFEIEPVSHWLLIVNALVLCLPCSLLSLWRAFVTLIKVRLLGSSLGTHERQQARRSKRLRRRWPSVWWSWWPLSLVHALSNSLTLPGSTEQGHCCLVCVCVWFILLFICLLAWPS